MQHQIPKFREYFRKHVQPSTLGHEEEIRLWQEFDRAGTQHAKEEAHLRAGYGKFAANWNRLMAPHLAERQMETIKKFGKIKPNSRVLSCGSGTGVYENYIAKYMVPQGKVTAVDLSEHMVKEAARLSRRLGVKNIEHIPASTYTLEHKERFNTILAIDHHLSHWEEIGKMAHTFKKHIVASPESRAIIVVILPSNLDGPRAANAFREAGFEITHEEMVSPVKYANHPMPTDISNNEAQTLAEQLPKMLLLVGRPA